ncbi:MAG TPA: hypothetical protein VK125_00265 [Bacillota bacterium]|nr:hypothetical protein [Bacillota bacterium]
MVARVPVETKLLEWACNRSMKQGDLHHKFSKLDDWLKGRLQPTLKQLEDYSRATSTPLGYFFLEEPPNEQLSIPHYRTVKKSQMRSQTSPDLIETLHMMQRRQDFMKDYYVLSISR